ncbi:hypothetical protein KUTeg_008026 [Tegillarca granosa]|uniref:Uncharacterized protein n=1 Tax=Tegillarca granosa TaxID=220873 RepID=A0ABQ9FEZ8_TEGGR|nr:hypothetical protein KUTeg_008026 [Tegillarca granosa]
MDFIQKLRLKVTELLNGLAMAWLNQNLPPDNHRAMPGNVPVRESDPSSPRSEIGFSASLPENMRLLNLDANPCQSEQEKRKSGQEHEDVSSAISSMPPLSSNPETLCSRLRESPQGASAIVTEHGPIQADEPNNEEIAYRCKMIREKAESWMSSSDGIPVDYSELSSSWGSISSSLVPCHTCEIYRQGFPSTESYDFWKSIDNHPNCHTKHFKTLLQRMEEKFPEDKDLLNDKKMKNVIRAILHAEESNDAAEVSLKDYLRLVRFFGPVCEDKNKRCILLLQLKIIIEKSLHQNSDPRRKEKIR